MPEKVMLAMYHLLMNTYSQFFPGGKTIHCLSNIFALIESQILDL